MVSLRINPTKVKLMSAHSEIPPSVSLNAKSIEKNGKFVYLRSLVDLKWGSDQEIEKHI